MDKVVPLEADTCSKLLTSITSLRGGFHGTLHFLKLTQSTFRNQVWSLIYFPLSFDPNLFAGFGLSNWRIKCLALNPKKSGNYMTPLNIFL